MSGQRLTSNLVTSRLATTSRVEGNPHQINLEVTDISGAIKVFGVGMLAHGQKKWEKNLRKEVKKLSSKGAVVTDSVAVLLGLK